MKKTVLIILAVLMLALIITFVFLSTKLTLPSFSDRNETVLTDVTLKWSSSLNKRQSHNSCAAYSTMAFLYVALDSIFDPERINSDMTSRMRNEYTYPWGVTSFLKSQGIKSKIYWFGLLDDASRIKWIKQMVSRNAPVILIVGNRDYLHYVTILGYSESDFYIYDSNIPYFDLNGDLPGNKAVSYDNIMIWWKSALFTLFRINLAISN